MRILTLLLFSQTLALAAQAVVLSERKFVFNGESGSPLREFTVIEQKKSVTIAGQASYSTDARIIYRTETVEQLQDYAIVQYIRGCQFNSSFDGSSAQKSLGISRHYFDGLRIFQHKDWSIDSDTHDPIYTSWNGNRFGLLRWNQNPRSFTPETATYVARGPAPHAVVFATDLPGSFTATKTGASNSSLEFETCLFRTHDLPESTTPAGAGVNKALAVACHKWDSKFVYDFRTKRYKTDGAIDPVCFSEAP